MRSRLFRSDAVAEADIRPSLLGVVTLLFLLLFFLLSTSTGQRLGVVPMRLSAPEAIAPLPHSGVLQRLVVRMQNTQILVEFSLLSTDISASATTEESHRKELAPRNGQPDYAGLQALLSELHAMDPSQTRAEVEPADSVPMEQVHRLIDVVRGPDAAPLFPKLALTGAR